MRLCNFKTDAFAGINNRELSFTEGMNILLGPNEAGKSSLVEAIYTTIFKDRLDGRRDKDFIERYMPYPAGDYIHGCLIFEIEGEKYRIEKEWGADYSVYLELPGGQKVNSSNKVNNYLQELFIYGEGTYNNIVFVKQSQVKNAIERIIENKNITDTVSSFLRKAVMELDGISVERLKQKIGEEKEKLLKKWDFTNGRPTNPDRDVNNPYKVGYGLLYEAYIDREKARQRMQNTRSLEEEFEEISQGLKEISDKKENVEGKIKELAELENDIFKRGQLEPKIETLNNKIKDMKEVNKKWPVLENELNKNKEELQKLKKSWEGLKKEKGEAERLIEVKELSGILTKINKKKEEIKGLKERKEEINEVSADDLKKLETLKNRASNTKAAIEAATLKGIINSATGKVIITRGIEEKEEIQAGEEFKADGYIHIETEELDIEIESGNINFQNLQKEYRQAEKEYKEILAAKNVKDLAEAKNNLSLIRDINKQIEMAEKQISELLEGRNYDELKEKVQKLDEKEDIRDMKIINEEIEEKRDIITDLNVAIKSGENIISEWRDKYESHDQLFDQLIDIRSDIKELKKELEGLAKLPEDFATPDQFKSHLSDLRDTKEELDKRFSSQKEQLYEVKQQLPDMSCEELALIYEENKEKFARLKQRAKSLLKIEEVFSKNLAEMGKDSFKPLVNSFSSYLSQLTDNRYEVGEINDSFEVKVRTGDNKCLPAGMNLLSYGTYDGVALALRFALLGQLFKDRSGFIVMDDCLINLDPRRKEKAIKLINDFAEDNQIIFTTCDPATAEMLGGNVIEV